VGQQIGNYQLIKLLGQGGCAKVYLGKHRYLSSHAALKVLNATIHPDSERRFLAEAQTLMDLRHPNIVHLLDLAIEDGIPVLIMDYAPKGSLRQYHPDGTQMPLTAVVDFVEQIAEALQYAHNHHIIHRDVKPENILLNADDHLLLSDFGLSLLAPSSEQLSTQDPAGTVRYMAPEQLRGKPCFASDQYALAIMVYEWLCGALPFRGTMWEISHQQLYTDPPVLRTLRPELSPMLEQVVRRALAKKPRERFVNVQTFAQVLAQASQTSTTPVDGIDGQVRSALPTTLSSLPITTSYRNALYDTTVPPSRNDPITQMSISVQKQDAPEPAPASALQNQNRMRLLQRVRSFWIAGVLEQSLHGTALMSIGLKEQPDAVANPWQLIMQETEQPARPLPAGPRITQIYDDANGELLILGEPGAGKTTLLLVLARDLLNRAEREQTHPMPVVFNLSSWTRKRQSLTTWLIEELETKYRVPRRVGTDWITTSQILPLLDGLDEVDASSRTACMQAINDYHQEHSLVPLVVCCRMSEYLAQANRLALSRAVTIQPLSSEQIDEYFAHIGEPVESLRIALRNDFVLLELATTPLMLTILILTYQGSSLEEIKGGVSAEVRLSQIFATYTQQVLQRRSARSRYRPEQMIRWLSCLAQQMKEQNQTVFYIERMQPTWLHSKWQRRLYYGLTTGPICGLLVGLETLGSSLWSLPLTVLMIALIVGLLFGWLSEPGTEKKSTKAVARTWMRIRQRLATALESRVMVGVAAGCVVGIGTAFYMFLMDFSDWPLGSRIAGALADCLLNGIFIGVSVGLVIRLERRIKPLEALNWSWVGIRRDFIRWFPIGIGLIVVLIFAFPILLSTPDGWLANFLSYGLSTVFKLFFIITLVSGVTRRLSRPVLDAQHIVTPNQGIWRSARYGVLMAIITGGIAAIFAGVIDFIVYCWLPLHLGIKIKPLDVDFSAVRTMSHLLGFQPTNWQEFWTLHALFWGPVGAAIPTLAVGLSCGGAAYVQHVVLRLQLWCDRRVPFNYARFLDYAAERILLRKVGGGYIFIHRLLLEYFASLEEEKQDSHKSDSYEHKAAAQPVLINIDQSIP
jgi:serine/threonine protein kinase